MRKGRRLTDAEQNQWDSVAKTATPMDQQSTPKILQSPATNDRPPAIDFVPTPLERPSRIAAQTVPKTAPLNMDAKSFGRMKRGKLSPEGRIDLHGMTVAEAHRELVEFVLDASAMGKRLVLVITGKGRTRGPHEDIFTRTGVLRHQVPQWLNLAPLKPLVLQVTPAHTRHGGDGAYYVYLKRHR